MTIALCFLTIGDLSQPALWDAFLTGADEATVYCHPKHPGEIATPFLREAIIAERVATEHGRASLVEATLALLRAAFSDPRNTHFVLLSETTVPIVRFEAVAGELARSGGKSLLSFRVPAPGSEHFKRQASLPMGCRLEPFFSHDQWIILSRPHVGLLLENLRLSWFSAMFAPDEHYFMNVLAHVCGVKPGEVLNQRRTFVNWTEREVKEVHDAAGRLVKRTVHPKTYASLPAGDIQQARQAGCWFFRKVTRDCDCRSLMALVTPAGKAG